MGEAKKTEASMNVGLALALGNAVDLHRLGKVKDAIQAYENIVTKDDGFADAHHMLGLAYMQDGQLDQAIKSITKATQIDTEKASYFKSLGVVLQNKGRYSDALISLTKATRLNPELASAWYNLAVVFESLRQPDKALEAYERTIQIQPLPEAYNNIGLIYCTQGRNNEAVQAFDEALKINPDFDMALSNRGISRHYKGERAEGLMDCLRAIELNPQESKHKVRLSRTIEQVVIQEHSPAVQQVVEQCLKDKYVRNRSFLRIWISLLQNDPDYNEWLALVDIPDYQEFKVAFAALSNLDFLQNSFLLTGIYELHIPAVILERLFTHMRRYVCEEFVNEGKIPGCLHEFLFALAEQCMQTQHVYYISDEEKLYVGKLKGKIEDKNFKALKQQGLVALLACYMPLCDLKSAKNLEKQAQASGCKSLKNLVKSQIAEPFLERRLVKKIESITEQNEDSSKYHEIYDEHPYPRWKSVDIFTPPQEGDNVEFADEEANILIAGCGTGQHAVQQAMDFPNAKILAVDFSLSTLAYAQRITNNFGINNIKYKHADILELEHYERKFNLIDCAGVIHHMDDPVKAVRILSGLVAPGGFLYVGVYSKLARKHVFATRKFVASLGLEPDDDGIREARRQIITKKSDDPDILPMTQGSDFYSLNSRYHIFPMEEHCFTIPEIKHMVNESGLKFTGFRLINSSLKQNYLKQFPDDPQFINFDYMERFEQENTAVFAGMYNFSLQKGPDK